MQLWGAADLLQELVESTSVDKVKRLRQVYEGKEEQVILLLAFLLQLSHEEDHVDGGSFCSKHALGLGVHARLQGSVIRPRLLWKTLCRRCAAKDAAVAVAIAAITFVNSCTESLSWRRACLVVQSCPSSIGRATCVGPQSVLLSLP